MIIMDELLTFFVVFEANWVNHRNSSNFDPKRRFEQPRLYVWGSFGALSVGAARMKVQYTWLMLKPLNMPYENII